jgi:hypothetical protein
MVNKHILLVKANNLKSNEMTQVKPIIAQENISFIDSKFEKRDAIDIITRLIHSKIKFHEDRISKLLNEEDIKMRESRIKKLQSELYLMKEFIDRSSKGIHISSMIKLESEQ